MLKDYNETYAHKMRDKTYLDAYLAACMAEGPETLYVGLRRAVQAHEGGFTWLARQTGLGRESLYRALRADGNPSFKDSIQSPDGSGGGRDRPHAHAAGSRREPQSPRVPPPSRCP